MASLHTLHRTTGALGRPQRAVPHVVPSRSQTQQHTSSSRGLSTLLRSQSEQQEGASVSTPTMNMPAAAPTPPPPTSSSTPSPSSSTSSSGVGLAGGAAGFAVAAVLASRLLVGGPSLAQLEAQAVPLDVAMTNTRPTVIEFYADWCEACRELAPVEYELEQKYANSVNFVMLNVENNKWAPELAEYHVQGTPHFIFLNEQNEPIAAAVGRLPNQVLSGNVDALAAGRPLPYARVQGKMDALRPPASKDVSPRDHA